MKVAIPPIQHDRTGFEHLANLHARTAGCVFDHVEIDMRRARWFDADMCAAFGAILYRLGDQLNTVDLVGIEPRVGKVLAKNGFLSHYGRKRIPDRWGTTVAYTRFDVDDDRYFSDYVEREFIRRQEMPKMSRRLLKKFRESVFEIFSNAVLHSSTQLGIFSCGQFFPKKNRLDFMVADMGVGICRNVRKHTGREISPEDAIVWATDENNTTKCGKIPGGLGLTLLREFVDLNGGRIQIVSDKGYWERERGRTCTSSLDHPFPGTVVAVEIDTADQRTYGLSSEFSDGDIF